jgi:imidazolonepropionase-like amidohydrolase
MVEPARSLASRRSPEDQKRRAMEDLGRIARFFDDMKAILAARAADATVDHDVRAEAMRDVLSGKDPVFVQVGSAAQIESAVAWFKARGMRCAIIGTEGIETAIPFLAAQKVPVVVNGVHKVPASRHAPTDAAYALPKKLADAGIEFSIATGDEPAHTRNLPHHAATAAAFGLEVEAALRAVTANPCHIAGISDRYGTIAPLKSATVILTHGHPLELTSDVAYAWIDGKAVDLSSHQSEMKAKYDEKLKRNGK